MRESILEVDTKAIQYNIQQIKQKVGNKVSLIPVIKADAYGLGAITLKEVLEKENIEKVAVAIPEEAMLLRKNRFTMDILVLNEQLPEKLEEIVTYNLTLGCSSYEVLEALSKEAEKQEKKVKVHIEIDTGMGRVGIKPEEAVSFMKSAKLLQYLDLEGIYTHFSSADTSKEYTEKQIEIFQNVLRELKKHGITFKCIHSSASSGILGYSCQECNYVRPGLIIYGYYPAPEMQKNIELQPSTCLKSKVVFVKTVPKGTPISYGRTYITKKETKIATIPMGYADGVRRSLSNKGRVYVNGKYAPIIGNICMDNFMVDITNIPETKVGDEVILWDADHITIEEIADIGETISYEILCGISKRVPRKLK